MIASNETLCIGAGEYVLNSTILIARMTGVTLVLAQGAVIQGLSVDRLLNVTGSLDTVVTGGQWIGDGIGEYTSGVIGIQYGSNNTVIEGTDVSNASLDGILISDNVRPSFNVSILDNTLHNNGRFGVQEFSIATTGMMGTVISGNVVTNNVAGGIYTNGIAGVNITENVVMNTVGNGPGDIGIGVTNGYNDTVTKNLVGHMAWFGIQAFYNNYTVIADNISVLNAGAEDQSGITVDHSSYSTVASNVAESNGNVGIYVERSWNVTISGNLADGNGGYGIALYHGSIPAMGHGEILGNICSFNGIGGMVLNSAIDNVISMNQCYNNAGDGIILYNDKGQVGSTGNLISNNWLGNEPNSALTQTYGVVGMNNSSNNTLISNTMADNTVAATLLQGN